MTKFLITCDPGLEDIAEMEIKENFQTLKFPNSLISKESFW
jgi:23S rRNA G2445 N2-methylase RlmL